MTVCQLRMLLERLPSDYQHSEVYLTCDGELDVARVLMVAPSEDDDADADPDVILAGSLDGRTSRYAPPHTPAPRLCQCDTDSTSEGRGEE